MGAVRLVIKSLAVAAIAAVVAGCGSGSSGSSSAAPSAQRGPGAFARDPKVAACLKKQGVTLPNRQSRPPGSGQRPNAAGSARFQKLRAALQKCGVTPPRAGQGGPPPATAAS